MRTQPQLRIVFAQPEGYIGDVRMVVLLDGNTVYDGGFRAGMDRSVPVLPGPHRIETQLFLTSSLCRTKSWDFTLDDAPNHTAELVYSRFWGNFKKRLTLQRG